MNREAEIKKILDRPVETYEVAEWAWMPIRFYLTPDCRDGIVKAILALIEPPTKIIHKGHTVVRVEREGEPVKHLTEEEVKHLANGES